MRKSRKQKQEHRDYIWGLYKKGKLLEHHVEAAARYVKLVYSGYASEALKIERVDCQAKYQPNMAGMALAKLPESISKTLNFVLIREKSVADLGFVMGAKSYARAYHLGLDTLKEALDGAANVLLH